jgi:hypothetical protein
MEKRHGSPLFYEIVDKMAEVHSSKSHDYASNENPYGNYHFAGMLSKLFNNPDDAGFIGRIGEKIYRLANLENSGKVAENESIADTELDICVITALWMASRRDSRMKASGVYYKTPDRDIPHPFTSQNEHPFCVVCGLHSSSHAMKEGK